MLNVLLGQGNDTLTIQSTLDAAPEDDGIPVRIRPRATARSPSSTAVATGCSRAARSAATRSSSPAAAARLAARRLRRHVAGRRLVRRASRPPRTPATSARSRSTRSPAIADEDERCVFPLANPFDYAGNDVIDAQRAVRAASQPARLPTVGFTAYGGAGDDLIIGSQTGDHLAGGSGDDTILGQRGVDHIYGDSGVNVDVITRELTIPSANASIHANHDGLAAGNDLL